MLQILDKILLDDGMYNINCIFQLAPKPVQLQGAAAAGQHPRLIVPAIAPNMNATSTGLQFPHGLISGGVVYLPQV